MESDNGRQNILVIDDEANMCHMLSAVLKRAGYSVDTAGDGEAGLAGEAVVVVDTVGAGDA